MRTRVQLTELFAFTTVVSVVFAVALQTRYVQQTIFVFCPTVFGCAIFSKYFSHRVLFFTISLCLAIAAYQFVPFRSGRWTPGTSWHALFTPNINAALAVLVPLISSTLFNILLVTAFSKKGPIKASKDSE